MHDERTMRWLERRSGFVPTTSFIDPRRYAVERLSDARAREFIKRHHYLTSFPAATGGRYRALVFGRIPPRTLSQNPAYLRIGDLTMLDAETAAYLENARKSALKGFPLSRVTEDFHDRMLESLPPIQMSGVPGFFVSEAYTDNVHAQFVHYRGRFYGAYVDVTDPESRIGRERIAAFHAEHSDDEPLTWYPEV